VRDRRATPVGEWFTVSSQLLEVDGRKLPFRVEARNARELIGGHAAAHDRAPPEPPIKNYTDR
jgi:predicted thioesterase